MRKFLAVFPIALWFFTQAAQADFILNELQAFNVDQADTTIVYIGTVTDTSNATTYTFTAAAIGNPAPNRQVAAICTNHGNGALRTTTSLTIDASAMTEEIETGQNPVDIAGYGLAWPTGTIGTFVLTLSGGANNAACSIWAIYSLSQVLTLVDAVSGVATGTTNCANTDLAIDERGAAVAAVGAGSNAITEALTWNGTDIWTEDFEASIEAADSLSSYSTVNAATTTTNDIDLAESASSNRACVSMSFR